MWPCLMRLPPVVCQAATSKDARLGYYSQYGDHILLLSLVICADDSTD